MVAVLDLVGLGVTVTLDLANLVMMALVLVKLLNLVEILAPVEILGPVVLVVQVNLVVLVVQVNLVVLEILGQVNQVVLEILGQVNLVHLVAESQTKAAPLVIHMVVVSVLLGMTQIMTVTIDESRFNFNLVSAPSSFLDCLILASCTV